ncbi:MAG: hypothetical protein EZS28_010826 [Streblomastix strix]|uniref:Uncharacterized protein n=1 Tax=Streblomastix strix TaxID=222440 RepID=A0A5J4WFI7_9EUKA|nr:MAG: hypothetical protein EZS28_010826 [Streblomastix strix]
MWRVHFVDAETGMNTQKGLGLYYSANYNNMLLDVTYQRCICYIFAQRHLNADIQQLQTAFCRFGVE